MFKSIWNSDLDEIKKYDFKGGWFEKKISVIATNMLQTPSGKQFFEQLVQPQSKTPAELLNFKTDVNDFINKAYQAKIIKKGEGSKAVCGNTVEIEYKLFNENDALQNSFDKKIMLGNGDIEQIIENSVIGMQVGEIKRVVLLNPLFSNANSTNKLTAVKAQITLKSLNGATNFNNIKIFDDTMDFSIPLLCGDKVIYDYNIQDMIGKQIYKYKQAKIMIGDKTCPPILAFGLYGKKLNGLRTIIVKGIDIAPLLPQNLKKDIVNNNLYLLELNNISKDNYNR